MNKEELDAIQVIYNSSPERGLDLLLLFIKDNEIKLPGLFYKSHSESMEQERQRYLNQESQGVRYDPWKAG